MLSNESNGSLSDKRLLEKIDRLFELNVGEYVDLPQWSEISPGKKAFGNTHLSGKSSVLEGLTRLPFPRNSGLCTRFATQITFRRSSKTATTVSIIPAADSSDERAAKLRQWVWGKEKTLDRNTFGEVLSHAALEMGLTGPNKGDHDVKTFSDDVLRIEICGPDQQHLSVVDVPGIFKRTTAGLTTKEDIDLVRNMVLSYMKNPRAVILAVIPANVDIATQEILELAEGIDLHGSRTLGVLTKPDLVDKGAEQDVLRMLDGTDHSLAHGWYLVKNPGQQQLNSSDLDREGLETSFFKSQEPWTRCPKDRVGSHALRGRLVELLAEMIETEFIKVKNEIISKLKAKKRELEQLGPARETREEQHYYLLNMADRFQNLTLNALKANYACDPVFESSVDLRLATAIVNRHELFSKDMALHGHLYGFENDNSDDKEDLSLEKSFRKLEKHSLSIAEAQDITLQETQDSEHDIRTRKRTVPIAELEEILAPPLYMSKPFFSSNRKWLKSIYNNARGWDMGYLDSSVFAVAWKQQSCKWASLSLGYVCDLISILHEYIKQLVHGICSDQTVRKRILSFLLDQLLDRYKRSLDQAKFCLNIEHSSSPFTVNHYFADELQKCQQKRREDALSKHGYHDRYNHLIVELSTITQTAHVSNLEQTVQDLHDKLRSYYKVARKRFVNTVCMQAGDYHLLFSEESPLHLFSPSYVSGLTDEQLDSLVGEDRVMRRKRQQLRRDIDNLETGKKVLI